MINGQSINLGTFIRNDVEQHDIKIQKRNGELTVIHATEVRTDRKQTYLESLNVTNLEVFEEMQRLVAEWKEQELTKLVDFDEVTAQVMQNPNFNFLSLMTQKNLLKCAQNAYNLSNKFVVGLTTTQFMIESGENAIERIKSRNGFECAVITNVTRTYEPQETTFN